MNVSSRSGPLLAGIAAIAAEPARADGPMSYLATFGPRGQSIAALTWGLIVLSVFVVCAVGALVLAGTAARRTYRNSDLERPLPVERGEAGIRWIYAGLVATTLVLAGFTFWTMTTMASISRPAEEPRLTIEITGHQWWWEARYRNGDPSESFETANELHIPVGEPVRLTLASADVIHSFWVPKLSGKTDLIPGRVNETWIEADRAGVYRGQCAEYCGKQHAHMAMRLFADRPDAFRAWWDAQRRPAASASSQAEMAGERQFVERCGRCHTVRGTQADGREGPDLTHLISRTTIAANTIPNDVAHLSGWIADPQAIKPRNKMPAVGLSGPELTAILAYLRTLD